MKNLPQPQAVQQPQKFAAKQPHSTDGPALSNVASLSAQHADLLALQRTIGNQAVQRLMIDQPGLQDHSALQRQTFPSLPSAQELLGKARNIRNRAVNNIVGDALNLRENEKALDLWEDYQAVQKALAEFKKKKHEAANFQSTTRLGMFDAKYDAASGVLLITCKCAFTFVNGSASEFPKAKAAERQWNDKEKQEWKKNFISAVSEKWSNKHTFHCQKDWWESLKAKVVVKITEVSSNEHFRLNITKIPKNGFKQSSVRRPVPGRGGSFTPGVGTFDSNDLKKVDKPGGKQVGAVHEAGHMLGLDDEYGSGTPSHSGLVQSEFGHGVARGDDGRIMSGGMDIKPEHGVTFLAALKQATGMSEWSSKAKRPRAVPQKPK